MDPTNMPERGDVLDSLLRVFHEPRRASSVVAVIYLMFTVLWLMQLASPGSLRRVAGQPLGAALLGAMCGLIALCAVFIAGAVLIWKQQSSRAPGIGDALLHASVAALGLGLLFGKGLLSEQALALSAGGAGLLLIGAGLLQGVVALRRAEQGGLRSCAVRGAIFSTVGALGFVTASRDFGASLVDVQAGPIGIAVVSLGALTFASYAAHSLWYVGEQAPLWPES